MYLNSFIKTKTVINHKEFLLFTGTSYLGVSEVAPFNKQLKQSIDIWGSAHGSSREANIQLSIYNTGEKLFAELFNTETSVTTSSGTLAGILSVKTLQNRNTAFLYMPKTHPSILPEKSFPVFIDNKLNVLLTNSKKEEIIIITDAIASLETHPYSFTFLKEIHANKKVVLLVDVSHYLGVYNDFSPFTFNNIETIFVSSLGKAYGINGGVIAGNTTFIQQVKSSSLFKGAAGMSPAFLDCFVNSQNIYRKQQQKLQNNCEYVFKHLKNNAKFCISKSYPVFFYSDEALANYLFSKNIIITNFYYPTSTKKLNRIVLNANHTKEELDFLIEQIQLY